MSKRLDSVTIGERVLLTIGNISRRTGTAEAVLRVAVSRRKLRPAAHIGKTLLIDYTDALAWARQHKRPWRTK